MELSRREMMLAALGTFGAVAAGCAQNASMARVPPMLWPETVSQPRRGSGVPVYPDASGEQAVATPMPDIAGDSLLRRLGALPRSAWDAVPPKLNDITPMGGITRMTVHHEGWTPVWFTSRAKSAERMKEIQHSHMHYRGWSDIGYHFVIDRAGRVWQARDLRYQGAHVANHNEHNIGVMNLGNFQKQQPTQAQLTTLVRTLRILEASFSIPISRIYTHQELMPTLCPGKNLQPRMVALRHNGSLVLG